MTDEQATKPKPRKRRTKPVTDNAAATDAAPKRRGRKPKTEDAPKRRGRKPAAADGTPKRRATASSVLKLADKLAAKAKAARTKAAELERKQNLAEQKRLVKTHDKDIRLYERALAATQKLRTKAVALVEKYSRIEKNVRAARKKKSVE